MDYLKNIELRTAVNLETGNTVWHLAPMESVDIHKVVPIITNQRGLTRIQVCLIWRDYK